MTLNKVSIQNPFRGYTVRYKKHPHTSESPDLFDTVDPGLLTYDFEEFSTVIDHLLSPEGKDEKWPRNSSDDSPLIW